MDRQESLLGTSEKFLGLDITASVRQICRVLWEFEASGDGTKELVSKNQRVYDMRMMEFQKANANGCLLLQLSGHSMLETVTILIMMAELDNVFRLITYHGYSDKAAKDL